MIRIRLDPVTGWPTGVATGIGQFGDRGLHLADGRGLAAMLAARPPWLAADPAGGQLLLDHAGTVRRVPPGGGQASVLVGPEDLGVASGRITALATSSADCYLLDQPGDRLLVWARPGYLRATLTPPIGWRLLAICGYSGGAAALVAAPEPGSAIGLLRHRSGQLTWEGAPVTEPSGGWTRCLPGGHDRVWLIDPVAGRAQAIEADGSPGPETDDGPGLEQDAGPLGARADGDQVLIPGAPVPLSRSAAPVRRNEQLTAPALPASGRWISAALDSGEYQCVWDVVTVGVELAPGSNLVLTTLTADEELSPARVAGLPDEEWSRPVDVRHDGDDFQVLSGPGRYLWVRVAFGSDGYGQVYLRSLAVDYPRRSLLRFLPAVYSADAKAADFLTRFLAVPGRILNRFEEQLDALPRTFDPLGTPPGFLSYLASWLDVPTEGALAPEHQRGLLTTAAAHLRRRGTPAAIEAQVRATLVALRAAAGHQKPDPDAERLPRVVEGFQVRSHGQLPYDPEQGRPLWNLRRVGRLRLGVYDKLGEVRLVDGGDPALDAYNEFAHRFAVYVPAEWVPTPAQRAIVRRALARETPAHVRADLVLVGPAMCLGVQSQLGIDTALAHPRPLRLVCAETAAALRAAGEDPAGPRLGPLCALSPAVPGEVTGLGRPAPGSGLLAVV